MITHRASESVYCTTKRHYNGLSRLTTTSNGQAQPTGKFSTQPMTFDSNRIESRSFAGP